MFLVGLKNQLAGWPQKKKKKKTHDTLLVIPLCWSVYHNLVTGQDLVFNKRPVLGNNFSSSICVKQLCCNAKKVSDEWTAESSCCQRAGKPELVAHIKPWASSVWTSQWWKLKQTQSCRTNGQVGRERGAADHTPHKNTAHHISADTTHVHRHTQRHKTPRKNRRNKRWASNQRALQQLNQHRLSDEQEHFWFLWAAAFINHPQKKHHSTTTWVEDTLFCCSLCRAEKKWKKKKGKKQIMLFSNKSNQLWSTSVSRGLMFQINNRHLHLAIWLLCAHSKAKFL